MSAPAHRRSLYDAIEALPEGCTGELIGGRLYTHPRPAGPHILIASMLGMDLGAPFQRGRGGPGGWWILDEPEVHFVRNVELTVPDLAGWRRERMPALPHDHRFEVVPDWICEIASPSTAQHDRDEKLPLYARYGVRHVWLIDPRDGVLEALELDGESWRVPGCFRDDGPVRVAPFAEVAIELPWR